MGGKKINNIIKHFLITGDTHGRVIDRLNDINFEKYPPEETALIILGDAGINYYLNKSDRKLKEKIQSAGYTIYCVRGNHEERPENLPNIEKIVDNNVLNEIYYEPDYPNIRYFIDGEKYFINGYSCLVIGGAYSVDKYYRLMRGMTWFKDEMLTPEERDAIIKKVEGQHFDFVFTHTTALSYEPRHLFLSMIDQSTVDNSMEIWLEQLKNKISYDVWCFGHYHADEIIAPKVELFFTVIKDIKNIYNHWNEEVE